MTNKDELELYIHIPFCVRKCNYCDFVSAPGTDEQIDAYIEALCQEIRGADASLRERNVTTVYMGGGTPSILSPKQLTQITDALYETFSIGKTIRKQKTKGFFTDVKNTLRTKSSGNRIPQSYEFTIECNPGTVTKEKLKKYRALGINRLSIGLQSMDEQELKMLGRIHTYEDFLEIFETARGVGFQNINVDLMQALPGQTVESWQKTLMQTMIMRPEHISAYSLIIEEGTPFHDRYVKDRSGNGYIKSSGSSLIKLPTEDEEREIYRLGAEILGQAGYSRYEISNYALPGFECRHNTGYWTRANYRGFGLNAASLVDEVRWKNTLDMDEYIRGCKGFAAGEDLIRKEVEPVAFKDRMAEYMFLGLRLMKGISKRDFMDTFGVDYDFTYGTVTRNLMDKGLICETETEFTDAEGNTRRDTRVALTERGIDVSNIAMAEFLPD